MDAARTEDRATRIKRLHMRSMRRGIKEMDILLMRFAAERLEAMEADALDAYEALLSENDQDLYQWVSGQRPAPEEHSRLVAEIARVAAHG